MLRPHGILRLGYVRVSLGDADLAAARGFYCDTLGLVSDPRSSAERSWLRCWHEAQPYSFVIERGGTPRLIEVGFELASADDLARLGQRIAAEGGAGVRSPSEPALPGMGGSLTCEVPGGLAIRLYVPYAEPGRFLVGHQSPDWVTPRELRATPAPLFLNHVGVNVADPGVAVRFLTRALGFVVSERVEGPDGEVVSALLFRMSRDAGGQELALFKGAKGARAGLHHIAFTKEDCNDILLDGQYLAQANVRIDPLGPTRQPYGKTFSLYFYDPVGLRFELCSGGRITEAHPEFEPVVWSEAVFHRALSFYDEGVHEGFFDACL
jgi:catechol 2,3-dioxygenase